MLFRPPAARLACPKCGLRFRMSISEGGRLALDFSVAGWAKGCLGGAESPSSCPACFRRFSGCWLRVMSTCALLRVRQRRTVRSALILTGRSAPRRLRHTNCHDERRSSPISALIWPAISAHLAISPQSTCVSTMMTVDEPAGRQHVRARQRERWTTRRGRRPWHVWTLLVGNREILRPTARQPPPVRIGKVRSRSR